MSTNLEVNDFGRRQLGLRAAGVLSMAGLGTLLRGAQANAATVGQGDEQAASGVTFSEIEPAWSADKLNAIIAAAPKIFGVSASITPARNGVKLYRVTYPSVVPEQGNRPTLASGLVAVPDTAQPSLNLVSYQHGTVYLKTQVPSIPDQSEETKLILAQFAGQGYAVIAADYFGMGHQAAEPEGYLVKESHQQALYDMLEAGKAVLAQLKITTDKLFICGWSQGGFTTMAFLEKLEASGVKVDAAATASAPLDGFSALSGFLDFPRKIDADWLNILFILTAFSYENYYGVPGLARALIRDEHYEASRKIYERTPDASLDAMPTTVKELVRSEYLRPRYFAGSEYGRLVIETLHAYRWVIQSQVRNYYGELDEIVAVNQGRIGMTYQQAMGTGNTTVEAVCTGKTDHRGTFMTAVPQWKSWFDSLA